jgi:hypothetical protein
MINKNTKIIENILSQINFKIQPYEFSNKKTIFRIKKKFFKILGKENEFLDSQTLFSNTDNKDLILFNFLKKVERMSSISLAYIINKISQNLKKNENYVNIGLYKGFTLFAGMINTKCDVHGVDNFSFQNPKKEFFYNFNKIKNNNHFIYEMDYKKFFSLWENKKKPINFYLYDANHSYEDQLENLFIAKEFFIKDTIIMIDDTNHEWIERATMDFISKYSDQYRVLKNIKTNYRKHPSFWNGFIIFEKK